MVLPLFLAMNASELTVSPTPERVAWMACHFSSSTDGLSNIPTSLPPDSVLILNDRIPCQGHSPSLTAFQISELVARFSCESILLDFQRPDCPETAEMVHAILETANCPVCVSEIYGQNLSCPLLLGPCPLHMPMQEYLTPWKGREIWLEAAFCQEHITVTESGTEFACCIPTDGQEGGFFDESLCCNYRTQIKDDKIHFTLFDTQASLRKKLELAQELGVCRAVGLYQEFAKSSDIRLMK